MSFFPIATSSFGVNTSSEAVPSEGPGVDPIKKQC